MNQVPPTNSHKIPEETVTVKPRAPFAEFLEEKEEETEDEIAFDGPVTTPFLLQTPPTRTPTPALRPLPSPLIRVVEEVKGPIQVISEKGVTKMEMVIQSQMLSEIKITIDHYDTAPHSFNIEFSGDAKAQALFIKYQPELVQSLQRVFPTFQINLLPPVFLAKNPLVKTERVRYGAVRSRKKADE